MAAAITGTLHAAVFTTERRSKLAFGAARLWISDIFYPKFVCGEPPMGLAPAVLSGILERLYAKKHESSISSFFIFKNNRNRPYLPEGAMEGMRD